MKKFALFVVLSLFANLALAKMHKEEILYKHGDTELKGYLYWDDAFSGQKPGILVMPEKWGMSDYVMLRAEMLAESGYVAFAADLYGDAKVTRKEEEALSWQAELTSDAAVWLERASLGLEQLLSHEKVNAGKIAAIGYSLGGTTVAVDEWAVDALYSGTQKCLSCPPGLAPVSFSDRALETIMNRKTKVPNWYLDISMLTQYWGGQSRVYHHTAPINMIYSLYQALLLIVEEGLENVFKRHMDNHIKLVDGLENLGLEMLVSPDYRLPMLNSVRIPDGANDVEVRSRLRNEFKIEIGAGLGPLAGKIWRIGLMGHTARPENVNRVLQALKEILGK